MREMSAYHFHLLILYPTGSTTGEGLFFLFYVCERGTEARKEGREGGRKAEKM